VSQEEEREEETEEEREEREEGRLRRAMSLEREMERRWRRENVHELNRGLMVLGWAAVFMLVGAGVFFWLGPSGAEARVLGFLLLIVAIFLVVAGVVVLLGPSKWWSGEE